MAGIESALDADHFHLARLVRFLSRKLLVEPESGAHFHRAALAVLVEQEQEVNRMDEMRALAEQAFALANRFADQVELSMFKISKAAMDDAGGAAGNSRSEIVLFDEQGAFSGAGTLPGYGNAIDPAPNDHHVEMLAIQ
jgi:hypothetical protein